VHDIVKGSKRNTQLCLCETKVLASSRDGSKDLLTEYLVAFVFGKVEFYGASVFLEEDRGIDLTVEASVRTWKTLLPAVITMDVESTEAVHTLQLLEPIEWYFAGSRDKL